VLFTHKVELDFSSGLDSVGVTDSTFYNMSKADNEINYTSLIYGYIYSTCNLP